MPLLNYTTKVPAATTISQIHALLVKGGARQVTTHYEMDSSACGIGFVTTTPLGERYFRLPVDVAAVETVLVRQGAGRRGPDFVTRKHAERVAWRIIKDWLEAQLALLETEMATLDCVMLPYMLSDEGRTFYELYVDRQLALPERTA
jgi:hypothetical protein